MKPTPAEVAAKIEAVRKVLEQVAPARDPEFLAGVAHDLSDFWEICEAHRERLAEIETLSSPADAKRLSELLEDLYYGDVEAHLQYHVEHMRETLPGLIDELEQGRISS